MQDMQVEVLATRMSHGSNYKVENKSILFRIRKIFAIMLLAFTFTSIVAPPPAFAGPTTPTTTSSGTNKFDSMETAGGDSKEAVTGVIQKWRWVLAILPFALAIFVAYKTKEYFEAKDEQTGSQQEPKASRYAKIVGSGVVAIVVVFLLYGVFGKVFAGKEFGTTWTTLVTSFWSEALLGGSSSTTTPTTTP